MNDLTINESEYLLENGKMGKIAVFLYSGSGEPSRILDGAVHEYTKEINGVDNSFTELIGANLDNPWMRVVISGVNDMYQENFDINRHHITNPSMVRQNKLTNII
jgi:hypothetical protein